MNEKIWEQQQDESNRDYQFFRLYLLSSPRPTLEKLAEMIGKSRSRICGIAAEHDWRGRAAAYDADLLEEARQTIKQELPTLLLRQWRDAAEISARAAAELKQRDLSRASFKSLNEIYATGNLQIQKLAELLKVFDDNTADKALTINIIPAE